MGDDERWASRGVNGDRVSVTSMDVLTLVGGGGGTLGGGERWLFMQSLMDEVDGMEEVEVSLVDGVFEGALGALGDEHLG